MNRPNVLRDYVARIMADEGRRAAAEMVADWLDLFDELAAEGVNCAPHWHEVTAALLGLRIEKEVEAVRADSSRHLSKAVDG